MLQWCADRAHERGVHREERRAPSVSELSSGLVMNMSTTPNKATTEERSATLMEMVPALFISRVSCMHASQQIIPCLQLHAQHNSASGKGPIRELACVPGAGRGVEQGSGDLSRVQGARTSLSRFMSSPVRTRSKKPTSCTMMWENRLLRSRHITRSALALNSLRGMHMYAFGLCMGLGIGSRGCHPAQASGGKAQCILGGALMAEVCRGSSLEGQGRWASSAHHARSPEATPPTARMPMICSSVWLSSASACCALSPLLS